MKTLNQFLTESGLARLYDKFQKHSSGAISGYRSENTTTKNKQNNKEIVAYLRQKGYSVTKVKGSYIENKGSTDEREVGEPSFIVVNDKVDGDDKGQLENDLKRLGRLYDQDSILSIPVGAKNAYLVGTSKRENSWPEFNQTVTVGSGKFGKASGDFFSRIKGRQFAFESIDEPRTINGIRGRAILAEVVEEKIKQSVDTIDLI